MNARRANKILDNYSKGMSSRVAAESEGVTYKTFLRYRKEHPEVEEAFARIKKPRSTGSDDWKKFNKFHPKASIDQVMDVLELMQDGTMPHIIACQQKGISVVDFIHMLNKHKALRERYKAIQQAVHMLLHSQALKLALSPDNPDSKVLIDLLDNSSKQLPEDSPLPKVKKNTSDPSKGHDTQKALVNKFYFDSRKPAHQSRQIPESHIEEADATILD